MPNLQWVQTALWERHRVRTLRRTLEQVADDACASLADDGSLTVDGVALDYIHSMTFSPVGWEVQKATSSVSDQTCVVLPQVLLLAPKVVRTAAVSGVRIGVVYLRAGYSPDDYPTPAHWGAREKLERSAVAKCPSVAFQLAGAKKVGGEQKTKGSKHVCWKTW